MCAAGACPNGAVPEIIIHDYISLMANKPDYTIQPLSATSTGIHSRFSRAYIRGVRVGDDSIAALLVEKFLSSVDKYPDFVDK
jgi:hypothetical protein